MSTCETRNENLVELPSGAVVKLRSLSQYDIRMLILKASIVGFEKRGLYADGKYGIPEGEIDPGRLLIRDIRHIEGWLSKDPLGRIREKIVAP